MPSENGSRCFFLLCPTRMGVPGALAFSPATSSLASGPVLWAAWHSLFPSPVQVRPEAPGSTGEPTSALPQGIHMPEAWPLIVPLHATAAPSAARSTEARSPPHAATIPLALPAAPRMEPHKEHGVHYNPQFFLPSRDSLTQLVRLSVLTPKVRLQPLGLFM